MAITEEMIEQYQHPRIKVVTRGVTIYEDDIVSGSFSYHCGVSSGGAFAPGGCVIGSCSFTVRNRDGAYTNLFLENTEINVYIGYGPSVTEATYDILCTVYVADVKKKNYKVMVSAYDKLRRADKKKWTSFNFPMTVNQIINSAAADAGISVNTLPSAGGSISVDLRDEEGNQPELKMTCRQAIAQALLISGNFGYVDAYGRLCCGWYTTEATSIGTGRLIDYTISDAQNYTGVQVYGQAVTGSSSRLYVLSSGSFITEDNCAAIQSRLYNALVGMNVRTASFTVVCNPNLRPGRTINVTMPQAGSTITVTVPLMSMVVNGGLKSTYTSETVSADEADDLRKKDDDIATKDYVDDAIKDAGGGGGEGSDTETIYIPNSGVYRYEDTGLMGTNGVYIEDGVVSISHPIQVQVPAQVVSVPSYASVLYQAMKHGGTKAEATYFPISIEVVGDGMSGHLMTEACWYDHESADAGMLIRFTSLMYPTCSIAKLGGSAYIGPFPTPYRQGDDRGYKMLKRNADATGWGWI